MRLASHPWTDQMARRTNGTPRGETLVVRLTVRRRLRTSPGLVALAAVLVTVAATVGCSASHDPTQHTRLPISFVPAGVAVLRQCRDAARVVAYAVPCPTRVPRGLVGTPTGTPSRPYGTRRAQPGCRPRFAIVGIGPCRPLGKWTRWITSSSEVPSPYDPYSPRQHLIILASPRPIPDYAKLVDGPGWYPGERVDVGGWISLNGWRAAGCSCRRRRTRAPRSGT